jgi:hypothetical protein
MPHRYAEGDDARRTQATTRDNLVCVWCACGVRVAALYPRRSDDGLQGSTFTRFRRAIERFRQTRDGW